MESTTPADATLDERKIEAAIDEMFREMNRLDERIRKNQSEINRLQAQTRTKLDALKAML